MSDAGSPGGKREDKRVYFNEFEVIDMKQAKGWNATYHTFPLDDEFQDREGLKSLLEVVVIVNRKKVSLFVRVGDDELTIQTDKMEKYIPSWEVLQVQLKF